MSIEKALRDLVRVIFEGRRPMANVSFYEGQYERQIQKLAAVIREEIDATKD